MSHIFEAKIECVVNRPFLYRNKKYQSGDIFLLNPNNSIQCMFIKTGRVTELDEECYQYILTRHVANIDEKDYQYGDIVDVSNLLPHIRNVLVKRGYFKKVIIKLSDSQKDNELPTYSDLAKSLGITFRELKNICKDKFDIYLPHHMTRADKDIYEKINTIIPKE